MSGSRDRGRADGGECPAAEGVGERSTGPAGAGVAIRVARAVAEAEGVRPDELPPLQEAIEADALERLVGGDRFGSAGVQHVRFEYLGYEVTVDGDGGVRLDGAAPQVRGDVVEE